MAGIKGGHKNGDRKSDRCGEGGLGTAPGHLTRRIKAYENMAGGKGKFFNELAFHKPGSNKK